MAYSLIKNGASEFAVDWTVVDRVLRIAANAELREAYSRVTRSSESTWYNPFSWSLPEIAQVDVDWKAVESKAPLVAQQDGAQMRRLAQHDVRAMAMELQYKVAQTTRYTNAFLDQMAAVQTENSRSISRAVDSYDGQIEAAKFVRDTSADGLMVGATLLTGGAATAVLAGGSAFKGYAKFQDTAKWEAAVMEGAGSFAFGWFPMGRTLSGKQEAALVIVQGVWEVGTGVASGQTFAESVPAGVLKLAGPGVDRLFGSKAVTDMVARAPIPMKVWASEAVPEAFAKMGVTSMARDVAGEFGAKLGGEVVKKQVVERFGTPVVGDLLNGAPKPARAARGNGRLLQSATPTEDLLLKFAIVNMQLGIGHGL